MGEDSVIFSLHTSADARRNPRFSLLSDRPEKVVGVAFPHWGGYAGPLGRFLAAHSPHGESAALTKHAQNLVEQVHDKSKLAPYNHCDDHHHQSARTSISMLKRMSRTDSSLHIRTCGIRGVTKRVL